VLIDLFNNHRGDLQHVVSLLLGLAMWRWGGGPERGMAVFFTGVLILPLVAFRIFGTGTLIFGNLAVLYVGLDVIALIGFVLIALNANRNYPLWIAGLQLVAVGAHMVRGFADAVSPLAYAILAIGPSYAQLFLMLIGLLRHRLRLRRFGEYRDWRTGHGLPRLALALSGRPS
jgi:hypothetical protein